MNKARVSEPDAPVCYVYVYWDVDGTPRYVGIGKKPNRWLDHARPSCDSRLGRKIRKLAAGGIEMPRAKVATGLTWSEACAEECRLIALYGRDRLDEGGTLYNLALGGEGAVGVPFTLQRRALIGAAKLGQTHTDEAKARMSASHQGAPAPNKGKPMSQRQKEWLRAYRTGRPGWKWSDERRTTQSASLKGIAPSPQCLAAAAAANSARCLGRPLTAEHAAKVAASRLGQPHPHKGVPRSPECIAKMKATKAAKRAGVSALSQTAGP